MLGAGLMAFLATGRVARATIVYLSAADSGWYGPGRTVHDFDAIVGQYIGATDSQGNPIFYQVYRGYYVFDLSSLPANSTISSAILLTSWDQWGSVDSTESYAIYDANATNIESLGPGYTTSDPYDTYADLGSGTIYGNFSAFISQANYSITLNGLAQSDIASAAGTLWAIGISTLTTNQVIENQNVFFNNLPTLELTYSPVPEPASAPALGGVLVLGLSLLWRRKRPFHGSPTGIFCRNCNKIWSIFRGCRTNLYELSRLQQRR
jgi:MYXO-CTERM domain-containing protein